MRSLSAIYGLLVVLTVGCSGAQKKSGGTSAPSKDDPLLGPAAPPVQATPLSNNPAVSPPPPLPGGSLGQPTSNSIPLAQATVASPAVLATGAYPPLPGGQDLRIGTAPASVGGNRVLPRSQTPPGVLAVVTADPDHGKPSNSVAGVKPVDEAALKAGATGSAGVGGLEQALLSIAAYQPKWHKLEASGAGTWRFSCSIPDRQEPSKSRTIEAEGPTAIAAVQQALDRIRAGT